MRHSTEKLPLDSYYWRELKHAYGDASDIPDLLNELANHPQAGEVNSEPYFTLWSSLYHQDDIYDASYAALPHLVDYCASSPEKTHWQVLQLAANIEFARLKGWGPELQDKLADAYYDSVGRMPKVAMDMMGNQNEKTLIRVASFAFAVANADVDFAEALIELYSDPNGIEEYLKWLKTR